jgi:medium-chain acyl-[acyl-carrier-protein] hydrolase
MTTVPDTLATHVPIQRPGAALAAYGVAHTGAGGAVWHPVAMALPDTVELSGIRLPGRESRVTARHHRSVDAAAREVAALVATGRRRPVLLIGSCSGAFIALAAAGLLENAAAGGAPVAGLLVARQAVPEQVTVAGEAPPTDRDSSRLRDWLRLHQLTPPDILDDAEAFEFFEPLLRADVSMVDGFRYAGPALRCPVFLVRTPEEQHSPDPAAWQRISTGTVHTVWLPVDGDPLTAHPAAFADAIGVAATRIRSGFRTHADDIPNR